MSIIRETTIDQQFNGDINIDSHTSNMNGEEREEKEKEGSVVVKKRGRPRKNAITLGKPIDKDKKKFKAIPIKKEIILYLPIALEQPDKNNGDKTKKTTSEDSDKNMFTMKDDDFTTDMQDQNNLTESNHNVNDSSDDDGSRVKKLLDELREKDKLIKLLKDDIDHLKSLVTNYTNTGTKDTKYTPINFNIIDVKSGKLMTYENVNNNLVCWWDTCAFNTLPFFIPEIYHQNKFHVFGYFCSPQCAAAYNQSMNDYKVNDRYSLIKKLHSMLHNIDIEVNIDYAPPREILTKFGGSKSIEEYRKILTVNNKEFKLLMPPLVPIITYIEEKQKEKQVLGEITKQKKQLVVQETEASALANSKVKQSWFDTMGIMV